MLSTVIYMNDLDVNVGKMVSILQMTLKLAVEENSLKPHFIKY